VLPDDARFCPSCGASIASDEAGEHVGHSGEERKIISVLFADLVGFTASSDGADPEDVRRRVQPFHTALREVVEGYGGRIEKLMGDGVLAVFGAPVVHEDDAERAVRAALQIQERVDVLAGTSGMRARVAVGTGEAMVLVDGTTTDREGLIGDVLNTASRLQGEAEPGTVLVDDATHRSTRRAIHFEERPPVAVKGKGEPIPVWVAIEPVARLGADLEDDGATLVGRSSELSLLVESFTRAVADRTSQIITIGGEPGVGKSRLVRELRRHINDLPELIRWRQGRCLPYGEGITYWALGEVVKAEAGIFETDTPGTALGKLGASLELLFTDPDERAWVAGRLAPLVGSDHEGSADKAERFAAWHRYVGALGEQRPTVIVVEDLHWADPNLVGFLADLSEAARGIPLLLVCTARPDFFEAHPTWGAGERNAMTIRLEPLDAAATRQLLDELLAGADLDSETRQMILDRSGGNPLWAQEFVRMFHDRPSDSGALAIPDTVQAVVASRIDLLDAETKTAIQAASTIGKSFWVGAVAELLDDAERLEESLRELARRELIRRERSSTVAGEVEYAFTHSVVRDVAYSQSPRAIRADRHHRAGRWIERIAGDRVADRAEVIAHHDAEALRLAAATDLSDVTSYVEAAISSHRRAAEQVGQLDLTAQRVHLEAALQLTPDGDDRRGSILLDLGRAYFGLGLTDSGSKMLLEARDEFDRADDIEGWGRASALLSSHFWVAGDPGEAQRMLDEAAARLEQHPPGRALAAVYAQNAGRLWLRGDSRQEALDFVARVRPIVEVHGDLLDRRRLLSAEGGSRFDSGDPAAVEVFREVLRMSIEADESLPIGSGYLNLGEQLRTGWGPHEAMPVHERGLEVSLQRRTVGVEQFLRGSLAVDLFLAGMWDESMEQLDAGLAIPERLAYLEGNFIGPKITIGVARGEAEPDAIKRIEALAADAEALEDLQAIVPAYESATWVRVMLDGESDAVEFARKIVDRSGGTRFLLDSWSLTVWLLRRAGELDRIGILLPELRRFDMPRPRALIAIVEALLAEDDDPAAALEAIDRAAAELAGLGTVLEAAIALAEAVRIAEDLGDGDRAEAMRVRAQELMTESRAVVLMEKLGLG
jgi:class 3 adenylate cyclase